MHKYFKVGGAPRDLTSIGYQVVAYLSDVFEAPRLKDQMEQYDKVLKNLAKQKSYNEESCKRDMRYHRKR